VAASVAGGFTILEPTVNRQPVLLMQNNGVTASVYAFDVADDHITRIWAVRNPEKLRRWTS
jgi:RNA polymerase sigma-70 factor (ECF subfamily)